MKIYDVTLPVSETLPVWPGDPAVKISLRASIADGATCNVSSIEMGAHSGTHIDAPSHFLAAGDSVESIPLETLLGPCVVYECLAAEMVEKEDLLRFDFTGETRVLLKTANSLLWENGTTRFNKNFVSLSEGAAEYLLQQGVLLVGIDYLSIEGFYAKDNAVHNLLLENKIVVLEGLNLSEVPEGHYELVCLPLKLVGCEGSPARVLLIKS